MNVLEELRSFVPEGKPDTLSQLSKYQRMRMNALLDANVDESAIAEQWMSFDMLNSTAGFAAAPWKSFDKFWISLQAELQKLFCVEKEYVEERKAVLDGVKGGQATFVATVATVLSPHLSVATPVLAPAVALAFIVLARAGRDTLCQQLALSGGAPPGVPSTSPDLPPAGDGSADEGPDASK